MATLSTNEAVARFYDAWNTGNVDILDQAFAADVVYHFEPFPDMDLAGSKQFILALRTASPDFQAREDEQTTEGGTTCTRWTCSSTFTAVNPLVPGEPTGKAQTTSGATIFHWKDGKAVEIWHFADWLGALQQQGVLPPMG